MDFLKIFTVSFFGHRTLDNPVFVEEQIYEIVKRFMLEKEYVDFLLGKDGEFDLIVASSIKRAKRNVRDDNSSLILILPYCKAEYAKNQSCFEQYYDEVEICFESSACHYKSAYAVRNHAMIDRSDQIIFFCGSCVRRRIQRAAICEETRKRYLQFI